MANDEERNCPALSIIWKDWVLENKCQKKNDLLSYRQTKNVNIVNEQCRLIDGLHWQIIN